MASHRTQLIFDVSDSGLSANGRPAVHGWRGMCAFHPMKDVTTSTSDDTIHQSRVHLKRISTIASSNDWHRTEAAFDHHYEARLVTIFTPVEDASQRLAVNMTLCVCVMTSRTKKQTGVLLKTVSSSSTLTRMFGERTTNIDNMSKSTGCVCVCRWLYFQSMLECSHASWRPRFNFLDHLRCCVHTGNSEPFEWRHTIGVVGAE